jgi:hypothetical protein
MKRTDYSRERVKMEDLNANGPSTCGRVVPLGINARPKRKM